MIHYRASLALSCTVISANADCSILGTIIYHIISLIHLTLLKSYDKRLLGLDHRIKVVLSIFPIIAPQDRA